MVMVSRWFQEQERSRVILPDEAFDVLALGYIRVSKKTQAGRTSPEAQRHDIAQYIKRRGWEAGEVFSDTRQGWRNDRPGYLHLREEVRYLRKQGRAVVVVSVNFDRTGRLAEEMLAFGRELDSLGVELHLVDENGTLTSDGRYFKAYMAEKETEKLRERVGRAKRAIARAGLPATSPAAWGYRWRLPVDENEARRHKLGSGPEIRRILDVNDEEAPSVRELFKRFAEGERMRILAAWVAALPAAARGSRNLSRVRIVDILRNPVYIARRVHPRVLAEEGIPYETAEDIVALPKSEHWTALIDDATWLAVQRRLGDPRQTHRGRTGTYLLTGLLRCPQCGAGMGANPVTVRGRSYPTYRCISRELGTGKANQHCTFTVPLPTLERLVLQQVGAVLETVTQIEQKPTLMPAIRRAWEALRRQAEGNGERDERAREVARLQQQLASVKRGLAEALAQKLTGEQEEEEYEAAAGILREKRRNLEARLEELGATKTPAPTSGPVLPDLDEALAEVGGWAGVLERADIPAQRELLATLIERVIPHRIAYGKYEVEITWTKPLGDGLRELAALLAGQQQG